VTEGNGTKKAEIITVTAEVRVVMVGSRQITMSVANQLDWIDWQDIDPMGRVSMKDEDAILGRNPENDALVLASFEPSPSYELPANVVVGRFCSYRRQEANRTVGGDALRVRVLPGNLLPCGRHESERHVYTPCARPWELMWLEGETTVYATPTLSALKRLGPGLIDWKHAEEMSSKYQSLLELPLLVLAGLR